MGLLMTPEKYAGGQGTDQAEDQQPNAKRSGDLMHRASQHIVPHAKH
jgi:hypothetical protein